MDNTNTKDLQFPLMSKEEFADKIKSLNAEKKLATENLKKYRKSLTDVKYIINQMRLKKDQIVIKEPKQLKGQKSLF